MSKLKCIEQIESAKKIAIITHQNADTDALASSIALKRIIKDNFDEKTCIDLFTETNEFSKNDEELVKNEKMNQRSFKKYDLVIVLDISSRQRLGIYDEIFKKSKDSLNIDHHATNNNFCKNNIVVKNCSSTCELLYLIFIKSQLLKCSPQTLAVLYSGIITDTANLTQNLGPRTFNVVDEITKLAKQNGIDIEKVRNHYFKNNTKESNQLLSRALESLIYSDNGKIAMMKITKQDFSETGTTQADTLGIVDYAINTEGVEIGIIFIKQDDNTYYVSLRSKNDFVDVGEIAKQMGGGGHKRVAAFQTTKDDNLTDVKARLTSLCNEQLSKTDKTNEDLSLIFSEIANDDVEAESEKRTEKNSSKKEEEHQM